MRQKHFYALPATIIIIFMVFFGICILFGFDGVRNGIMADEMI